VEWLTSKADKQTIKKFLKYAAIVSGILIISTIVVQSANTPIINYGKALVQQRIDQGLLPTEGQFSRSLEYYLDNVPTVLSHILGDLWILITMAVLFTLALFLLFRSQKHAKFFLAAIIFFELLLFATPHIMTKPTEDIFNQDEITSQLLEDPELFRVFDTTKKYPFYKAQVHGIDFVERGSNILTKEYAEFTDKIYDNEISEALPYLNLLNVKYLVIEINKTFVLEKNNNTLPRAYIVRNAEVVETSDELNNLGAFNPRETVLLAKIPETPLANPGSFKETEIVKYKPNHIDIQLNLETAGYLVLSEMHYPNWNAYDNGKKVEILQANMIMRTVYLEKGPHYVQFIYQPKNLQQGLLVTLISLVVLIGLFFYLKKQSQ
ncbi:MAG: YfhO family protein, partial [Candidatus Woesearchaeota archaeon]|nr:YfhO family protein [Candidatus Woesearchaeota archaeon]